MFKKIGLALVALGLVSVNKAQAVVTDGATMVATFAPDPLVLWAMGGALLTVGAIIYVIKKARSQAGA